MKRIKPSLFRRGRCLVLMARGMTVYEACEVLRKRYYPEYSIETVKSAFCTRRGPYAIFTLEGQSREVISKRYSSMIMWFLKKQEDGRAKLAAFRSQPDWKEKWLIAHRRMNSDPAYRARLSEWASKNLSRLWRDPKFKLAREEENRRRWRDPAHRESIVKFMRQQWQDPEYRSRITELLRTYWNDPVIREIRSQASKICWQDPVYRDKVLRSIRARWREPEYRAKMLLSLQERNEARRTKRAINLNDNEVPIGWENRHSVPIIDPDYTNEILKREAIQAVKNAISQLPMLFQAVLCEAFNLDIEIEEDRAGDAWNLSEEDFETILLLALSILRENLSLKEISTLF